jgi:hypothetical protein
MDSNGYESRLRCENVAASDIKKHGMAWHGMAHRKSCECCATEASVPGNAHAPKKISSICILIVSVLLFIQVLIPVFTFVRESLLFFFHMFPLNLIILRVDVNVLGGFMFICQFFSE